MRSYRNPFRLRTSEQQQPGGEWRFLRTFGPDVLDLLPESIWDRPLLIRSAPGGGKTSTMRLFTVESLMALTGREGDVPDLHRRLVELGAYGDGRPQVLGVLVSLDEDYGALLDLGGGELVARKLFCRLLDARIMTAVARAAVLAVGRDPRRDLKHLRFEPEHHVLELFDRLGGTDGQALVRSARRAQGQVIRLMDSLLPVDWEGVEGHGTLYSLRALSATRITVDRQPLEPRPLIMLDDGHELASDQRRYLLEALTDRSLTVHRWYSERFDALSAEEVVGEGGPVGRAYEEVHLEDEARRLHEGRRRRSRTRGFERLLLQIGNLRAQQALQEYGEETDELAHLLEEVDGPAAPDGRGTAIVEELAARVSALADEDLRYADWLDAARRRSGYPAAVHWRELEILIRRDRDRTQEGLFSLPLTGDELKARSGGGIREAAALFVAREFRLPYYAGARTIANLASHNIEQFLELAGDLFEEMLALMTLREKPRISAARQHAIVRAASQSMWRRIAPRREHGRDIQHLLWHTAVLSRRDTFRPKASYAPGVTGTALSMRDRARLLDPETRTRIPGADHLLRALAGAISHNLLEPQLDRPVKDNRWMVLYLNRLLLPAVDLPLGYGGFRERRLEDMASWFAEEALQPEDLAYRQEVLGV